MTIRTHGRGTAVTGLGLLGAVAVGFWIGRGPQSAVAAPLPPASPPAQPSAVPPSDWDKRVVAYIYGSIPITREDLGEYLIARKGLDSVELLVNKKIIEHACEARNITVTDAEVDASILADCETIQIKKAAFFETVVRKNFGKTPYEWKEDIVKPRLLLTKLVKDKIAKPTDEELHHAFDSLYGRMVEVRVIIWPKGEERIAMQEYDAVRKDEQGFDRKARTQANSSLAATGGKIKPIAHNAGVHPEVEQAAFSLQPGEVSRLIATQEGTMVLKVDKLVEPNATVKFEEQRAALEKDVFEKKVAAEIPILFKKLRDEAKPMFILKKPDDDMAVERNLDHQVQPAGAQTRPPR
jgi:parvulin-like peptidyl-prolyl isomerase